ncbi:MAG: response regulator transcription factor [Vampirovibrionales bacterium]
MASPVRLLIVDDDPDILSLMQMDFELMGFEVHTAKNGMDALKFLQGTTALDIALVDVMMPKLDGYALCKHVRELPHRESLPIILLTAKSQLEDKVKGFHAGADDYLVKPFELQELMVRMRALFRRSGKLADLQGKTPITQSKTADASDSNAVERLAIGDLRLLPKSLEVFCHGQMIRLTPTEFEILYCLVQHANEAVSLSTLLQEVWGYDASDDVRTVRVHVGGLRQKVELNAKQPTLIQTVNNVGYRLNIEESQD